MCDCKIPKPLEFDIGDVITFYYDDQQRIGKIDTVGKHGYWIKTGCGTYGTASIRCPFKSARRVL
jgi:hypothetical protein